MRSNGKYQWLAIAGVVVALAIAGSQTSGAGAALSPDAQDEITALRAQVEALVERVERMEAQTHAGIAMSHGVSRTGALEARVRALEQRLQLEYLPASP